MDGCPTCPYPDEDVLGALTASVRPGRSSRQDRHGHRPTSPGCHPPEGHQRRRVKNFRATLDFGPYKIAICHCKIVGTAEISLHDWVENFARATKGNSDQNCKFEPKPGRHDTNVSCGKINFLLYIQVIM